MTDEQFVEIGPILLPKLQGIFANEPKVSPSQLPVGGDVDLEIWSWVWLDHELVESHTSRDGVPELH